MSFKLLKGSQLGAFFPIGHNVLLHWIQTSLSQQPEIVFSWNKRINWAYSFVGEKSRRVLLFLKALSSETDLLVTLGDFTVENAKFGREICIKLKTDLAETKSNMVCGG